MGRLDWVLQFLPEYRREYQLSLFCPLVDIKHHQHTIKGFLGSLDVTVPSVRSIAHLAKTRSVHVSAVKLSIMDHATADGLRIVVRIREFRSFAPRTAFASGALGPARDAIYQVYNVPFVVTALTYRPYSEILCGYPMRIRKARIHYDFVYIDRDARLRRVASGAPCLVTLLGN
ncbi:hypothetical protein EVAR_99668_1 [Eumeta japonica]|uniref:Uncharacterized protein n=1 Tax=Eumeta variegata TaxID=151549 RepID=A0A4C2A534_EUMVA|nr:hypothetical protein EVAR_99668_1 [Eumeta japonica]